VRRGLLAIAVGAIICLAGCQAHPGGLGQLDHEGADGGPARLRPPVPGQLRDPNDADGDGVVCEYGCLN
jgi:hypothetical protein